MYVQRSVTNLSRIAQCFGYTEAEASLARGLKEAAEAQERTAPIANPTDVNLLVKAMELLNQGLRHRSRGTGRLYDPNLARTMQRALTRGPKNLLGSVTEKSNIELALQSLGKSVAQTQETGQCASEKVVKSEVQTPSFFEDLLGLEACTISKSSLGAVTTPAGDGQRQPGEFLYFRKVPVFRGGEYKCYLGIDMTALRHHGIGSLTPEKVRDCLVLIKKARVNKRTKELLPSYQSLREHHTTSLQELAPGSIVPGTVVSPKKSALQDTPVERPLIVQKLYSMGTLLDRLNSIIKSAYRDVRLYTRADIALDLCQKLQQLVEKGRKSGIVFGDLKEPNIAETADGDLVLCDLGCLQGFDATDEGDGEINAYLAYSLDMASPEAITLATTGKFQERITDLTMRKKRKIEIWRRSDLHTLGAMQLSTLLAAFRPDDRSNVALQDLVDLAKNSQITWQEFLSKRNEILGNQCRVLASAISSAATSGSITPSQAEAANKQYALILQLLQPQNHPVVQIAPD